MGDPSNCRGQWRRNRPIQNKRRRGTKLRAENEQCETGTSQRAYSRINRDYSVTFDDITHAPAVHDVGDAAILLHAGHAKLGDQFAIAADVEAAFLEDALIFTDVNNDEIPLRVRRHDLARQTGGETRAIPALDDVLVEFSLRPDKRALQNLLLVIQR